MQRKYVGYGPLSTVRYTCSFILLYFDPGLQILNALEVIRKNCMHVFHQQFTLVGF